MTPVKQETVDMKPEIKEESQLKRRNGKNAKRHLSNVSNNPTKRTKKVKKQEITGKENDSCDTCPEDEFDSDHYDK